MMHNLDITAEGASVALKEQEHFEMEVVDKMAEWKCLDNLETNS